LADGVVGELRRVRLEEIRMGMGMCDDDGMVDWRILT
jgi:hypothetical protein